jgi:hypothetical protein
MKVRELAKAKYHINSKHITIETPCLIYTTDKKAFFNYYKEQFHKGIQYVEERINIHQQKANIADSAINEIDIQQELKCIKMYRESKVTAINTYRQIIETIKKL